MLFNSAIYLLYLPAVILSYFSIPHRYRWMLLLLASYIFYMWWKPGYALLILFSTVIDYFAAIQMGKETHKARKKKWLWFSLITNLGLLFTFKYFDFFSNSLEILFNSQGNGDLFPELNFLLPVGISFYTFQTLSYTIDVYRGDIAPEKHFGKFALFVSFFPQLVAGPIERPGNLLPQFNRKSQFNYENAVRGLNLIAYGLFKKVVVADRCAVYVDEVFQNPLQYNGWVVGTATFFFAFQIYCDFSGYTDIAIGSARMIGIDLMENFNRPYLAKGFSDFWKRWHISLSTWFRDYFYIPIGGNKSGSIRTYFNLCVTFLVSGLWHGANWTFLLWGAWHGLLIVVEKMGKEFLRRLRRGKELPTGKMMNVAAITLTFILVSAGWIFFRARSWENLVEVVSRFQHWEGGINSIIIRDGFKELGVFSFGLTLFALCILALGTWLPRDMKLKWNTLFLLIAFFIILFIGRNTGNEFIYFQF